MSHKAYTCGHDAAFDVVGGKWKGLILWALRPEARRFGELRRVVRGISEKMLIQHLKEMEADGIVSRRDFREIPPRVEYALTPFGYSLWDALSPLCEWGALHMKRIEAQREIAEVATGPGAQTMLRASSLRKGDPFARISLKKR